MKQVFQAEIETPVGKVLAKLAVDRDTDPISGEFSALNNTTPLSQVQNTEDGFTAKTMFKAAFLKLPVDLTCKFDGANICGEAKTNMGDLSFVAVPSDK